MFINVVAQVQVNLFAIPDVAVHNRQQPLNACHINPIIRIDNFIVQTRRISKSLIDAFSMPAVLLMNHADNIRIFFTICICDVSGVIRRAIVHKDNLNILCAAASQQR